MEDAVNIQFSLCLVPFISEDEIFYILNFLNILYYKRNLLILTLGIFLSYLFTK